MSQLLNRQILKNLNSKSYEDALSELKRILKAKKISNDDLITIMMLKNKIIVSDFFFLYPNLTKENFIAIEFFINENLHHRNKLFVSDLIEIAIDFNLNLNYKKCFFLLKKYQDDNHYVLIAVIEYLFTNLKTAYISEIADSLDAVLKNKEVQLVAHVFSTFYLYRITYQKKYYSHLKKLLAINEDNNVLVSNLLKKKFNSRKYFEGHAEIIELIKHTKAKRPLSSPRR